MSSLRHVTALLAVAAIAGAASAACNAITGTGKYDLVDCPSGACGDGGGNGNVTAPSGPGSDAASSPTDDSGMGMDAATAPVLDCGPGTAPVTLTVTGTAGSVSAKSGGNLSVSSGSTGAACLVTNTVEMRTSGPSADWTGPSCKDGNNGTDRCEFGVPAQGISITAALR